ncbi:695_t:CDS:2 [Diversispora eburnea]|uniref:695_t:CDS:1 n=1 Tax=Diversispora eburnea TaxID=1213867 RepID=A0A9N9BM89_9GLOM|nr:695_t:CDS:2 [Diversispora eburnea]
MIRLSLNQIVLLTAWITIFSLTSSVSEGYGNFTHNETKPYSTPPRVWQHGEYFDGTVVLRIINRDSDKTSSTGEAWIRQVLSLRIIHPNGTVSEIDKDLKIQEFNWRITSSGGDYLDPISIYALHKGFILVRYFNASDSGDFTTYEEWGRIIDWDGKLYSEVFFGGAYIINGTWGSTGIVTNVNPEKGFIRIAGNITLPQNNGTSSVLRTIATVDEGYSIIMGNFTNSSSNNPFEIRAAVYALTKGYNDEQFDTPRMIYQLPLDNITISDIFSGTSSTGIGQVCTLHIIRNDVDYYVKLNFLSSGSITEIIPLSINLPELPSNSTTEWQIDSIPLGGYLYHSYFIDANSHTNVIVYYFDEYTNKFFPWDAPEPSVVNLKGVLILLPNNTMLISQIESSDAWSFLTTDIPHYSINSDYGYLNLQIKNTSPLINVSILTSTDKITITYYDPVELSNGYIWIYQYNNSGDNIIRQFVNGVNSFCNVTDNGLIVTVNVIKSAFSNSNSQFYVKVDDNFVRNKAYKETLAGINDNIWKFNTSSNEEKNFADTVSGVLRLTIEGTEYYENLNSNGKDQFFADLHLELSRIIPVNIKRLSSNRKTQVDTTVSSSRQILISLNIESSNEERSVAFIVDDLNDMIVHRNMTSISLLPTTKYLDENFGFKPKQNLWDEYKWEFLGIMLILAILVVLFLIAQKMNKKGHYMAILQLGLIIFDLAMDILFVSKNAKVIKALYIPSKENKSKDFRVWFTQNEKAASVFTVLSSADIEILSILNSNLAGFKIFQAPISIKGKNRIFWVSCLTVFVEDIPQMIIQLLYHFSVITYDIIPLLTLASSCLNLLVNIIGRLFQTLNICRFGTLEYDSTRNQDDFENLQTTFIERNFTSDKSISHSIDGKEENEKKY